MAQSITIDATAARQDDLEEERRSARTLVDFAYKRLRRDILCGALKPGAKLRVEHLKNDYGVGAGTLREALSLLLSDALVTSEGQRGFRVAPISMDDLRDVTRVRTLMEVTALRESIENGDDDWEAELVAAYHRLSKVEERMDEHRRALSDDWEERNRGFHEALVAASKSNWLFRLREMLYQQSERYRRLALVENPVPRDVHAEHKAIFEAALARDADEACRLMTDHIERTFEAVSSLDTGETGDA
ncbi:MAG: transcriptional regulator [Hyphomicrobiales bacterium]|nr:MAG: transcriptional regulator [Hyphomicrobiales bacterium]